MKRKLQSRAGYTLLEALAALIIVTILLTSIVAGTVASVTVYRQSTSLSEAQVLSSTLFEVISDELRFASDVTVVGGGDTHLDAFTSTVYGPGVLFSSSGGRITLAGYDLINEKAYTGLDAAAEITYAGGVFAVTIVITDPGQDNAERSRAEFSVMPLNS